MRLEYPIFPQEQEQLYSRFWDHSQIKEAQFREQLSRSQSFKNCFDPKLNLTAALKRDIKRRTTGDIPLSLVIEIYGTQGDGKSKLGIQISKEIDPTFNAKKIFMKPEDLLDYCKEAKPNDCLMLDEQALQFGEGSLRQQAELQNIEEITRIKQIHFIYCSPTLREHMAKHYTLKVIQKNVKKRITKFAFANNNGSYFYGWGMANIPKDEDCPIYQKYEPIKLKYVDETLQRSGQKYDLFAKADVVLDHRDLKYTKNNTDIMVLIQDKFPTLTIGEHKKILSAMHILRRKAEYKQKLENLRK